MKKQAFIGLAGRKMILKKRELNCLFNEVRLKITFIRNDRNENI